MDCNALLQKIEIYSGPNIDIQKVIQAFEFCKECHKLQIRASGEPYYYHPLEVAIILADMRFDEDSIITGLLHDTVEDTNTKIEEIRSLFGESVANLVDGVTKLAKIKFQSENIREKENFRKLLLAMSQDIRVLIVKLADRLHNMRTINYLSDQKSKRIAQETMEIFAPLAERIGMQKLKNELQDLAFAKLYPEERQSILNRLKFLKSDEGFLIDKIETHIRKTIQDVGIKAEVQGREKTPCSIWQKMKSKNISFAQLSDIIAFRVIVTDVIDCYQVLGIIHAAYRMIPDSFKDYISAPKSNGYSSLHTVVVGPNKQKIEIQIRTKEMHRLNEWGVAAHWEYKLNIDPEKENNNKQKFKWIGELLNILENSESDDFIENTKLEIYEDQVFCFTPKGEVIALPKNSTPVDFAYSLHSDIGNTCAGAKINGNISPLKTILENGDQVEIICSKTQFPSRSWEKFVVTARAKLEIKKYIRSEQRKEYISLGKAILTKYFQNQGRYLEESLLREKLTHFHKKNIDEIYMAVGDGTLSRNEIYNEICGKKNSKLKDFKEKLSFFKFNKQKKSQASTLIRGISSGTTFNLANCCNPVPGEQIIGLFHQNGGIDIHTSDCHSINNISFSKDQIIEVFWEKDNNENNHTCKLRMTIANEINSLASICSSIAKHNCNISNLKFINRTPDFFELILDIEVMGIAQLVNIIATLRANECVHYVERYKV